MSNTYFTMTQFTIIRVSGSELINRFRRFLQEEKIRDFNISHELECHEGRYDLVAARRIQLWLIGQKVDGPTTPPFSVNWDHLGVI